MRVARFEDYWLRGSSCVQGACSYVPYESVLIQYLVGAVLTLVLFVSEVCGAVSTFDCIWQVRYSVVVVLIEELGLRFANIRTNAAAT